MTLPTDSGQSISLRLASVGFLEQSMALHGHTREQRRRGILTRQEIAKDRWDLRSGRVGSHLLGNHGISRRRGCPMREFNPWAQQARWHLSPPNKGKAIPEVFDFGVYDTVVKSCHLPIVAFCPMLICLVIEKCGDPLGKEGKGWCVEDIRGRLRSSRRNLEICRYIMHNIRMSIMDRYGGRPRSTQQVDGRAYILGSWLRDTITTAWVQLHAKRTDSHHRRSRHRQLWRL